MLRINAKYGHLNKASEANQVMGTPKLKMNNAAE